MQGCRLASLRADRMGETANSKPRLLAAAGWRLGSVTLLGVVPIALPIALLAASYGSNKFPHDLVSCLILAFWLLGVRDWLCVGAALLSFPVQHGLTFGAIDPFLMLWMAAAWLWREQLGRAVLIVGALLTCACHLFIASPIVWTQYLALLFVLIAVLAPRLSVIGFVSLIGCVAPYAQQDGRLSRIPPLPRGRAPRGGLRARSAMAAGRAAGISHRPSRSIAVPRVGAARC